MLVKDAMNRNVKITRADDTVKNAAKTMTSYRIGSLVVVSGAGKVIGIVTERNILNSVVATGRNSKEVKIEEIMTKDPITISPDKTLEDAAEIMTKNKIKKLPVIENGKLIGIITASDLIAYEKELIEMIAKALIVSPFKSIGG
ncbi:MAG: cyclic nucleotide-binding/CBS domain-containing protein [Candidatus Aenigmatarchaeota archaeon]